MDGAGGKPRPEARKSWGRTCLSGWRAAWVKFPGVACRALGLYPTGYRPDWMEPLATAKGFATPAKGTVTWPTCNRKSLL
jgi:hypothetical protein